MSLIPKSRKEKLREYDRKYGQIPKDDKDRMVWMISNFRLSPNKMNEIIEKKRWMETYLKYNQIKIVLYEDPEGAKRPRFRLINRKNYMNFAIQNPEFVHVYSPNAAEDHRYMHRLVEQELVQLNWFVQTPCRVTINAFFKTPSYFNITDIFLAECGIHRKTNKPDYDNIEKKYSDMFNGNIWLDDELVVTGIVNKFYSILPRVEIYVDYLNYATNVQQYRSIIRSKNFKEEYPLGYLGKDGRPVHEANRETE